MISMKDVMVDSYETENSFFQWDIPTVEERIAALDENGGLWVHQSFLHPDGCIESRMEWMN